MKEALSPAWSGNPAQNPDRETEVVRAARVIEWLKAELVGGVACTLRGIAHGHEEAIVEGLADTILHTYLLARRLGISPARLDLRVENKLTVNISQGHQLERWYGDLSFLAGHIAARAGGR